MEQEYLTLAVHEEFARRVQEENDRQNHRLSELENAIKAFNAMAQNVERLAVSMENMTEEQKKQGERLDKIEEKPAKRWDSIITAVVTGVVGLLLGALLKGIIL